MPDTTDHEHHDHDQEHHAEDHAAPEDHAAHGGHAHDHGGDHSGHAATAASSLNRMAGSATLHCLTGCAIGEILGLIIGTALGLSAGWNIVLAIALAFLFGYTLSTLPLLRSGLALGAALTVVLAADTLSIAVMEIVDNLVVALIPGAMSAGLVNPLFWVSMLLALTIAFFAAYPVNRALLKRGKGHALTHAYHGAGAPEGARRFIPNLSSGLLVGIIVSFLLGGLLVAGAATVAEQGGGAPAHAERR